MAPGNQPLTTLDEVDLTNLRTVLTFAANYMAQTMKDDFGRRSYLAESRRLSEKLYWRRQTALPDADQTEKAGAS